MYKIVGGNCSFLMPMIGIAQASKLFPYSFVIQPNKDEFMNI